MSLVKMIVPYLLGAISINIQQIQIDGKMDTVHLQKQLQMYIRTKGLSVIARLHCIGIITHNVVKDFFKVANHLGHFKDRNLFIHAH
jgi:hypothetical protein